MQTHLQQRARKLRKTMTEAETKLWYYLRNCQLNQFKFRRQVPIGNYIVDFLCFKIKLIIELDGSQHIDNQKYDKVREIWLKEQGFTVRRYWNDEVLQQTQNVLEDILRVCLSLDS